MQLHAVGLSLVLLVLSLLSSQVESQVLSGPPSSFPLAVRSPYFSAWLFANNGSAPGGQWPSFWNGRTLGWAGSIRVDGVIYQWMGVGFQAAKTVASYITPTRSIFTLETGPVHLNLTFLSPVEPSDLIRQSFPFTYLYADIISTDGNPHSIQIYLDVTGEWVTGDTTNLVEWGTSITSSIICQKIYRSSLQPMTEINDMSEDGMLYYAMKKRDGLTWQTGGFSELRAYFNATGSLNNTDSTLFRQVNNDFPVIAMSVDLKDVMQTTSPLMWAMGLMRDPVIRRTKGSTTETRSSFYWTKFNTIEDAVEDFVSDFPNAQKRAIALDTKISADGLAISQTYADLLALSLRQVMASMDITVSKTSNGWNQSDVQIYMKDVGTSRRSNPVEMLYASFPAILYLNSSLAGYLLDPLLEYQSFSGNNSPYAAPDLGVTYPDALGNSTGSVLLAVENCGNMLIMALAHALKSGDASRLVRYYDLLKTWADYLVSNSLHPSGLNADGENNPDMSNLALKGIVGIRAMAEISKAIKPQSNATNIYMSTASSLAKSWQDLAFATDHITSTYGQPTSWGLIYNLFWDKFLKTNVISQDIYDAQTTFYTSQAASAGQFGLPYDSNDKNRAKPHWTMFTAAATTDTTTRDLLVSMIHTRGFFSGAGLPFPSTYGARVLDPALIAGKAGPAAGAMFAILADNLPSRDIVGPQQNAGPDEDKNGGKKNSNVAAIAGGVVGSIIFLGLLGLAIFFWKRQQKRELASIEKFGDLFPHKSSNPDMRNEFQTSSDLQSNPITPFLLSDSQQTAFGGDNHWTLKPPLRVSSKLQEVRLEYRGDRGEFYTHAGIGPTESSNASSSIAQNRSSYPPSVSSAPSAPPAPPASTAPPADDLRNEVNELRREINQIRFRQDPDEPPPLYHEP